MAQLTNPSQLVLRNLARLRLGAEAPSLLVVNYPSDGFLPQLRQQAAVKQIVAFTQDYAVHCQTGSDAVALDATDLHFAPVLTAAPHPHAAAIVFLPKSRALVEMTLTMIAPTLAPGALVWLVGENGAGIRSSQTLLTQRIGPVRTLDNGRHCVLYQATLHPAPAPFNLDEWAVTYSPDLPTDSLTVVSLPGVFSHGRLDEGSRLLLTTLEQPVGATVLDFACGAGVIGAAIQQRWPRLAVDLTDVNALALEATRRTLAANGLAARAVFPSDVFSAVTGQYDQIIANPPFHSGVAVSLAVVTAFLQSAGQHLTPNGALRIVANRFLDYPPLMTAHVGPCRLVTETGQFNVYESRRSRRA